MKSFLNYKIKINKKKLYAGIGITYIVLTAFLSRGVDVHIESDEPLEDIVIACTWSTSFLSGLHGGSHHVTRRTSQLVNSGEQVGCGMNWYAGLDLSFRSIKGLLHPTHRFLDGGMREDGVQIRNAKSKLELLDELKAKFEAGFWDKYRNSSLEYARSFGGCGFGHQYLDYYSEVKQVDKNYFYKKYNAFLLECNQNIYEEVFKHDPDIAERSFNVDKAMSNVWNPKGWIKYENSGVGVNILRHNDFR